MTRRIIRRARAGVFVAAAALAACSSSTDSGGGGNNPPAADVVIVQGASLKGFQAYSPDTITVNLGGAPSVTVVWRNDETGASSILHTVTDTATVPAFDTGGIAPGAVDSITFNAAGNYAYKCTIHQGMRGLVVVQS